MVRDGARSWWAPGDFRTSGNKADATGDKSDSQPPHHAYMLMESETGDEGEQHISQRTRRQNISEISPRKGGHVGREKANQKDDPQADPGVGDGQEQAAKVTERNVADLLHAVGEERISHGRKDSHPGENQVFAKIHGGSDLNRF